MTYSMRLARTNRSGRYLSCRGARVANAAAASLEALESRLLLTAVSWNGGTGNFNVAANWSDNLVPNTNDDVTIGAGVDSERHGH